MQYQWNPQTINSIYTIVQRGVSLTGPLTASHGAGTCVCPLNTDVGTSIETYGQYVSSRWWPVWLRYWLYVICTQMSNWDGLWWSALMDTGCHVLVVRNDWHTPNLPYWCVCNDTAPGIFLFSDLLWEHRNEPVCYGIHLYHVYIST